MLFILEISLSVKISVSLIEESSSLIFFVGSKLFLISLKSENDFLISFKSPSSLNSFKEFLNCLEAFYKDFENAPSCLNKLGNSFGPTTITTTTTTRAISDKPNESI